MPKDRIEFSGAVPPQEAAQYLESIAKGLRERSMLLESGDTSITVDVADEVKIEIKASSDAEKGKSSIELSLGWRQREHGEEPAPPPGLLIVAGAPVAEAASFAE
ncbi:MAG TPA: amphi-Trp domain-containing protein [Dehalococcoidia bacterium]|jgi:amphi-Trp domain-containing protein